MQMKTEWLNGKLLVKVGGLKQILSVLIPLPRLQQVASNHYSDKGFILSKRYNDNSSIFRCTIINPGLDHHR